MASIAFRAPAHVHWRRFDSDLVILDLNRGEYFGLNDVGADAFEKLAAGDSYEGVVHALLGLYDVAQARLESDVGQLIETFVKRGLLAKNAIEK